ncbi:MAG TPA: S41 family peptidase [Solirubrobacteraceae bacterium]|nr:S41 family peptidase [Solirubrobacteraceae bacterium]
MPAAAYLRYPAIRGDRLVLVADDDLWIGSIDGERAWRLGAERATIRTPKLSPEGGQVAWCSDAAGHPEVWVADLDGAEPRRLTWWGDAATRVLGWRDERTVVAASATGQPFPWRTWAWAVPVDGGRPERLPYGPITALSEAAGGGVVLGADQTLRGAASWKRYRGGTAAKAWIDADGTGTFRRFADGIDGQIEDPQWWDGRVVFLSDHEGWGNVYSAAPDGSDLRRHSDHGDGYARNANGDGSRLVYGCLGDLWLLDSLAADATPRRLDIRLGSARYGRTPYPLQIPDAVGRVAPDRGGRASALDVRGAAVWCTHRDGPARVLAPGGKVRARFTTPLGDTHVVWVTDAGGDDALEIAELEGESSQRLAGGELGQVVGLAASADGARVATAGEDGAVRITDVADGTTREIDRSSYDIASGLCFSPDSRWLAWAAAGPRSDEAGLRQIKLADVGGSTVLEATPLRFHDGEPAFTPDGRYLAFLSRRTFDPVYDQLRFDLSFPVATRPYLLRLAAATPGPLSPATAGRALPWSPPHGHATPESAVEPEDEPVEVRIDPDGLASRLVELPVAAGRLVDLRAIVGGLVWRSLPVAGELGEDRIEPFGKPVKGRLEALDFATGKVETLAGQADAVEVSGDGRTLVVRTDAVFSVQPADRKQKRDDQSRRAPFEIDLDRIRITVEPAEEWVQMFDEAARLMRRHYWVEDMAGIDWDAVVARYRPLAGRVATRDELHDLIWELQGELATSHAYVLTDPPEPPAIERMGHLGADLERDDDGAWRIARLPAAEPSVPGSHSPLEPVGAQVGDVVESVDGRAVDPVTGPGPLLVGAGGKVVAVGLRSAGGDRRTEAVTLLADERPLRYHAWVAANRAAVRAGTGGRVGYLHVPDMMSLGWGELHRDLRIETALDALVCDFRGNRGGHTSELVLERLSSVVTAWDNPRGFEATTYPVDAPRGPMVALCDQNAGSDGDIVSMGFRQRNLGPLIGTRTWGGVIGIDMRYRLVDGTRVTQPRYAFWFEGGPGWSVENYGVQPDVEVAIAPHDWAAGRDPQLEKAIELVLAALEQRGPKRPPRRDDRPDRSLPQLPPRP